LDIVAVRCDSLEEGRERERSKLMKVRKFRNFYPTEMFPVPNYINLPKDRPWRINLFFQQIRMQVEQNKENM
jgi:hypothetical protein